MGQDSAALGYSVSGAGASIVEFIVPFRGGAGGTEVPGVEKLEAVQVMEAKQLINFPNEAWHL